MADAARRTPPTGSAPHSIVGGDEGRQRPEHAAVVLLEQPGHAQNPQASQPEADQAGAAGRQPGQNADPGQQIDPRSPGPAPGLRPGMPDRGAQRLRPPRRQHAPQGQGLDGHPRIAIQRPPPGIGPPELQHPMAVQQPAGQAQRQQQVASFSRAAHQDMTGCGQGDDPRGGVHSVTMTMPASRRCVARSLACCGGRPARVARCARRRHPRTPAAASLQNRARVKSRRPAARPACGRAAASASRGVCMVISRKGG